MNAEELVFGAKIAFPCPGFEKVFPLRSRMMKKKHFCIAIALSFALPLYLALHECSCITRNMHHAPFLFEMLLVF